MGYFFVRRAQHAEPMYKLQELIDYVSVDKKLIGKVRPDLIVGDMRQSLCVSTRLTNTTYIALTNAYWSKYINHKKFIVPELRQIDINGIPFVSKLINIYFYFFFKNQGKPLNALRRHFKLAEFEHCLDGWNFGDHLIFSDPSVLFDTSSSPDNHHFLGSVNWEPNIELPYWWNDLSDTKKTAYVALGSSGDKSFIPPIVDKLLKDDFQIIISGVDDIDKKWIPRSKSIFSAALIPGSVAAAKSEMVFSNGGSPTSYQSLLAGTPVIGIPTNLDQLMSMKFIALNGLGEILRPRELGTDKHAATLTKVQKGDYKNKAQAIRSTLCNINPEANFSHLVSSLCT